MGQEVLAFRAFPACCASMCIILSLVSLPISVVSISNSNSHPRRRLSESASV